MRPAGIEYLSIAAPISVHIASALGSMRAKKPEILVAFLILLISLANTASADQVTLVANSTGNYGYKNLTTGENLYPTTLTTAQLTSLLALTATELTALSANDASIANSVSVGNTNFDSFMYVNFTLADVESANWVQVETITSLTDTGGAGNPDITIMGLWNFTNGTRWENLNSTSILTPETSLTYNVSSTADKTKYLKIDANNNLNFSLIVWTNNTEKSIISGNLYEAIVNYVLRDNTAPSVVSNTNNVIVVNGSTVTLNATITDAGSGVKNATVNVSQINSTINEAVLTLTGGYWLNTSIVADKGATGGFRNLTITAYDNAGNRNNSVNMTVQIIKTVNVSVSEAIVVTATVTRTALLRRTVQQTITLTDSVTRVFFKFVSAIQGITVSPTVVRVVSIFRDAIQGISVADSIASRKTAIRNLLAAITVSADVKKTNIYQRLSYQALSISDALRRTSVYNRAAQQALTITDTVSTAKIIVRNAIQSLTVSAESRKSNIYQRLSNQALSISDSLRKTSVYNRAAQQALTITDTVSTAKIIVRNAIQSLTVSAESRKSNIYQRLNYQALSISDSLRRASVYNRAAQQALTITDTVSTAKIIVRNAIQSLTVSAESRKSSIYSRLNNQTITITDALRRTAVYNRSAQQSVTVTDTVSTAKIIVRNAIQSFTVSADVKKTNIYQRLNYQTINITDAVRRTTIYNRFAQQSLNVTDAVSAARVAKLIVREAIQSITITADAVRNAMYQRLSSLIASITHSINLVPPQLRAPNITSWSNNKTNNQSLSFTINTSEIVRFNATANQTITTWNWFRDDVNQSNNNDSFNTSFTTAGEHTIKVNATNANGTSNTINWTVSVQAPAAAPNITSWGNNKTNNATLNLTVTISEDVRFNATANQTINTWNWYKNDVNQNNNYDNLTTNFTSRGTHTIKVSATNNTNGTSTNITWNVTVPATTIVINITSPANNSVNTTGYVNVTVTLDVSGTALLNWDGVNESMNGAGTEFYKNKTGLLSGNFSFKVYANDSSGISNVSETRIVTVNRTIINTTIGNFINTSTFVVNTTLVIAAPSGNVTVTIPNGTNASLSGAALTSISIGSLAKMNPMLVANLSVSDKLIGENLSLGPDGARFSPDIQVRFNYAGSHATALGIAESDLTVKFYNTTSNAWESLVIFGRNTIDDYLIANISHFTIFALVGTPTAPAPAPVSAPVTGGGGGGGGAISPEPPNNIEMFEIIEEYLGADVPASYIFTTPSLVISEVLITPAKNFGVTSIRVEMLKDISQVEGVTQPSGVVYKYANIWVGAKELEMEDSIVDAFIGFKVESYWLAENNLEESSIKLLRWDGRNWGSLDTVPKSRDEQFVYYESKTPGFSPFAIVAVPIYPSAADRIVEIPTLIAVPFQKIIETIESKSLMWASILIALILISLVLYKLRIYKKAIGVYEKAMELKPEGITPENADAWYNKGFDLYKIGKYDEALKAYDKAREIIHKSEKEDKKD